MQAIAKHSLLNHVQLYNCRFLEKLTDPATFEHLALDILVIFCKSIRTHLTAWMKNILSSAR